MDWYWWVIISSLVVSIIFLVIYVLRKISSAYSSIINAGAYGGKKMAEHYGIIDK
jgi:hypothetical protein